jgi:hypothetical protein
MASATRGNSVFDFYGKGLIWDFLYEQYGPLVSGHSRRYKSGRGNYRSFSSPFKKTGRKPGFEKA